MDDCLFVGEVRTSKQSRLREFLSAKLRDHGTYCNASISPTEPPAGGRGAELEGAAQPYSSGGRAVGERKHMSLLYVILA